MKGIFFIILLSSMILTTSVLYAKNTGFADTAGLYFEELKAATKQHSSLWNIDLYAPVLLVNPKTREVYANMPDAEGILKAAGKVYTGLLPGKVNISNTSIEWSGQNWAMVMLPLSKNKNNRIHLLTHELFHRAQKSLGFVAYNPDNNHLDKKNGRIYLRLELEALKKAVAASLPSDQAKHIGNALLFRKYRYSLYPGADSTENLIELNEGICEYTGMMMSGRTDRQQQQEFISRMEYFILGKSYVRSFAYETIPVYGYLLLQSNKYWNKEIKKDTKLTDYFSKAFNVIIPKNLDASMSIIMKMYEGDHIVVSETARDESNKKTIAAYKAKLVDQAHLEIPLEAMNMSFDYNIIVPLEGLGTVYPVIRITDKWGILEVTKGALISNDWKKVSLSIPVEITGNKINGDGWTLDLKEDYFLQKSETGGSYIIKK